MKLDRLMQRYRELCATRLNALSGLVSNDGSGSRRLDIFGHAAVGGGALFLTDGRSLVKGLSDDDTWLTAIHYCQGVFRRNLEDGRVRFRELDDGMAQIAQATAIFRMPVFDQSGQRTEKIGVTFRDLPPAEWAQMFYASQASQDELALLVSMNLRLALPIPQGLNDVLANHLFSPRPAEADSRGRKPQSDRDALFVWLAKRVSDLGAVPVLGDKGKDEEWPRPLTAVSVVAAAYNGLGLSQKPLSPGRARRIWEDKRGNLEGAEGIEYRLTPDFLTTSYSHQQSTEDGPSRDEQQMKRSLEWAIYP